MITAKKLMQMAKKWQRAAAMHRKRVLFLRSNAQSTSNNHQKSPIAQKGHFVVYSTDNKRFVVPLSYLNSDIVRSLLEKSEEEFGLPMDAQIMLPVDSFMMEYIISLISRGLSKDQEKALLVSVVRSSCSSSLISDTRFDETTCQLAYICS